MRSKYSAGARLERLPIAGFHRYVVWILAFAFFFELGDLNTLGYTAPAVEKAWHLKLTDIGNLTSWSFAGMFLGATLVGYISDLIGRKKSLITTVLIYSVFSLLNAFAMNLAEFSITRFLTGFGLSAMTVVGITYISEVFPAKKRGTYQGLIMTVGLAGIPITSFVSRLLIPVATWGWRLVFVWGALGFICALLAIRMKESPRWLENRGRFDDANRVTDEIEAIVSKEKGTLSEPVEEVKAVVAKKGWGELFSKRYGGRTVVLLLLWILQTLGFYGFVSWVPTLLVAHGFSLVHSLTWSFVMSIGAVPGAFIAYLFSDKIDRKWLVAIFAILIAGCGLIYGLTFNTAMIMVFGFLVNMFIQTFAPLLYAYTPELYPTEVRNSGSGLTYGAGRLFNIANGFIVPAIYGAAHHYSNVFIYIAACWLLLSVITFAFGPRTKGRALEIVSASEGTVSA
ncbi:MFS transporter [Alicyclobacillus fastidiosus]|uniref:MFS transporter n=1 Tax=Alicyclobacillus fastidiosus TaxID=392011 RepID=A0ABY6ZFU0_9BACL|nr:MFS transporter [Alicyclobacillus fastidiosus]WAH41362.1 MFS transporter [Alicyclobacillus fastidiosus]GMA62973.1 putative metabolite transport protein YyaJ [Alicyclobacillus fastidiosus]